MRIGVLTTSYPREPGDPAGHFVEGFATWLAERGASVEVVAAGPGGLFYRGGAVGAWRRRPVRGSALAAAWCGRFAHAVAKQARSWDAVVSHWLLPCGVVGMATRLPHLAIAHGSDVEVLRRLPGGERLVRALAARGDLVYVAESLRVDGARGRVVPMGIEPAPAGDRARGRRDFQLSGCVALILARLSTEKGIDLAIGALPPDVTLVVAGDGPEQARLEVLARGRAVQLVGEVRGARKQDLLAAADLLLVPSRRDGAPTVVSEAAMAGLPIIATNVGALPELVGDAGLVCAPDPDALRRAIERLRDDEPLRARLSQSARSMAAARSWLHVGPRLAGSLADRLAKVAGARGNVHINRL
jgi:glycosyltransferase involved in cell wall biosynthesis